MKYFLFFIVCLFIFSCSNNPKELPPMDMNKIQESLLEANKNATTKEAKQIDGYVESIGLKFTETLTGLRYFIYEQSEAGELIKKGQTAVVRYVVTLLDGTECYSTKDKVEEFIVGKDYVETGLHEGIQFMRVGDKATLILPSHLAHGLAGDFKKVPFRSTIVYDIELVAIK